mmetsp:Transcript_35908/g.86527  ORF Transcript_35908/g.86527 Transcript_35908/m.86527 type:complete len:105 (-) Transcript_35908:345-659(-)
MASKSVRLFQQARMYCIARSTSLLVGLQPTKKNTKLRFLLQQQPLGSELRRPIHSFVPRVVVVPMQHTKLQFLLQLQPRGSDLRRPIHPFVRRVVVVPMQHTSQ